MPIQELPIFSYYDVQRFKQFDAMININTIYHKDCFDGMLSIADNSIDLVVCDMPYGVTNNAWDSVLDLDRVFKSLKRICKKNAAIILFGTGKFSANLIIKSPCYRYSLVWEKTNARGFLNANRRPLSGHEDITVHYEKLPTYNPQKVAGKPYRRTRGTLSSNYKFVAKNFLRINKGDRHPTSVIKIKNSNYKSIHPTQKPVALIEWLIKSYSNAGDLVLDFCMGSGTTAIAAINTNRNFIGFEKDKNYFDLSLKRIQEAYEQQD